MDQRADLYALGATLYELATGQPPFGAGEPQALIHDHLARVPVPPAEANPAVPRSLSQIILHLLEKEPDQRYQSAEACSTTWHLLRRPTVRRCPADSAWASADFPHAAVRRRPGWSGVTPRSPPCARPFAAMLDRPVQGRAGHRRRPASARRR